jgi:hypothetical protein
MAMLRHRDRQNSRVPAVLLHSSRNLEDVIYRTELDAMAPRSRSARGHDAHQKTAGGMDYAQAIFNPYWGEQLVFAPGGVLSIAMVLQGLDQQQAEATWRPFFDWISASPQGFSIVSAPKIISEPARRFWDPAVLMTAPGLVISDDRPGAPADNIFWGSNLGETGRVWHAYQSAWLPQSLLADNQRERLVDALFEAAKHRGVSLHFNKGLAGATAEAIAAARDTAMNPAVADAFALAISGAGGPPAYPDVPGHEPDAAGCVLGRKLRPASRGQG